jgi:hypothetical protein
LGNNPPPTPPSRDSPEGWDHSGDKFAEDGQAREPAAIDSEEAIGAEWKKDPRQLGTDAAKLVFWTIQYG